MRIVIEVDGPVLDVQPAYWQAYQQVAAELGWARIDAATFWRLLRTGASAGQILRGSKPRHWEHYRTRLTEVLESDEIVSLMKPRPDVGYTLQALKPRHELRLASIGRNVSVRQQLVDGHGWTAYLAGWVELAGASNARVRKLRELTDGPGPSVVVAAGTLLAQTTSDAGIPCVGAANGACTPKRLTQSGAAQIYDDLVEFSKAVLGGRHPWRPT